MHETHGSPASAGAAPSTGVAMVHARHRPRGRPAPTHMRALGPAIALPLAMALAAASLPAQRPVPRPGSATPSGAAGYTVPVCTSSEVVPPAALASAAGPPTYIEATSAVVVGGELSVFGSPTFFWHDMSQVFDTELATRMAAEGKNLTQAGARLLRDGAVPIPLPGEDGRFITPRAVEYPKGVALVIWGTTTDPSYSAIEVDTLWQASFDGKAWTSPVAIYAGGRIPWTPDASEVFSDGERVHVSFSSDWHDGGREPSGPVLLEYDGRRWRTRQLPVVGMPPVEVARVRGTPRPLQAYLGGGPVEGRVVPNGVVLAEHGDGPPAERIRLLHDGGEFHLGSLHAVAAEGVSYLMWLQSDAATGPSAASRIEGYASRDGGQTWRKLPGQKLPGRAMAIRPWVLDDGSILVVSQADPSRLLYTSALKAGAWGPVRQLPYTNVATVPTLLGDGERLPILTWGAVRGNASGPVMSPQSQLVRISARCGG